MDSLTPPSEPLVLAENSLAYTPQAPERTAPLLAPNVFAVPQGYFQGPLAGLAQQLHEAHVETCLRGMESERSSRSSIRLNPLHLGLTVSACLIEKQVGGISHLSGFCQHDGSQFAGSRGLALLEGRLRKILALLREGRSLPNLLIKEVAAVSAYFLHACGRLDDNGAYRLDMNDPAAGRVVPFELKSSGQCMTNRDAFCLPLPPGCTGFGFDGRFELALSMAWLGLSVPEDFVCSSLRPALLGTWISTNPSVKVVVKLVDGKFETTLASGNPSGLVGKTLTNKTSPYTLRFNEQGGTTISAKAPSRRLGGNNSTSQQTLQSETQNSADDCVIALALPLVSRKGSGANTVAENPAGSTLKHAQTAVDHEKQVSMGSKSVPVGMCVGNPSILVAGREELPHCVIPQRDLQYLSLATLFQRTFKSLGSAEHPLRALVEQLVVALVDRAAPRSLGLWQSMHWVGVGVHTPQSDMPTRSVIDWMMQARQHDPNTQHFLDKAGVHDHPPMVHFLGAPPSSLNDADNFFKDLTQLACATDAHSVPCALMLASLERKARRQNKTARP